MRNPPPDAAESLRKALERNLDWIKTYIPAPEGTGQGIRSYIDWIYDRLKENIPVLATPQELDRLVRNEVRNLFDREASNGARKAFFGDVGELEDPSALRFERRIELSDEVRVCLECLPTETRELVVEAFTLTEADLSGKDVRDGLAARLGINRNTLDQRISRAIRRMRERMRDRPGCNHQ